MFSRCGMKAIGFAKANIAMEVIVSGVRLSDERQLIWLLHFDSAM